MSFSDNFKIYLSENVKSKETQKQSDTANAISEFWSEVNHSIADHTQNNNLSQNHREEPRNNFKQSKKIAYKQANHQNNNNDFSYKSNTHHQDKKPIISKTRTLVSFIGKGIKDQNNPNGGYRKTKYCLNDKISQEVTFICKALYDFLTPQKIVIIGTSGSSWVEVLSNFLTTEQIYDHQSLINLVTENDNNITQIIADQISEICSQLTNCKFVCKIFNPSTQQSLLSSIIDSIDRDDQVYLDITHGYRSIPMIALTAIQYLKFIKKVNILNVFYGQFECLDQIKPIVSLSDILELNNWITSFAQYDKTNDLSLFTPLIKKTNPTHNTEFIKNIEAASFKEKLMYAVDSINIIKNSTLELDVSNPLLKLLEEPLKEKLAYVNVSSIPFSLFLLSKQFIKARDFFKAVVYLQESLITYAIGTFDLKFDLLMKNKLTKNEEYELKQQLSAFEAKYQQKINEIATKKQVKLTNNKLVDSLSNKVGISVILDEIAKNYLRKSSSKKQQMLFDEINALRNGLAHSTPLPWIEKKYYKSEEEFINNFKELSQSIKETFFADEQDHNFL